MATPEFNTVITRAAYDFADGKITYEQFQSVVDRELTDERLLQMIASGKYNSILDPKMRRELNQSHSKNVKTFPVPPGSMSMQCPMCHKELLRNVVDDTLDIVMGQFRIGCPACENHFYFFVDSQQLE